MIEILKTVLGPQSRQMGTDSESSGLCEPNQTRAFAQGQKVSNREKSSSLDWSRWSRTVLLRTRVRDQTHSCQRSCSVNVIKRCLCVYIYGVIFVKTYNIPPLFDILTIRPSFPSYYWHNEAFFWPQAPTVTSLTSLCVRVPESISIYLGKYLVFLLKCVCCSESKGLSLFWAMKGGVLC